MAADPVAISVNVNFLACFVLFVASRPKWRVLLAAIVVGAALGAYLGFHGNLAQRALEALSYCGAGAIPAVWIMPLLTGRSDLKLLLKLLFPPFFGFFASFFLNLGSHGLTYDHFLYAFDGSLGFQPSFWAGRLVTATPLIGECTRSLYAALPIFLAIAYLVIERQGAAAARRVFVLLLLVGVCGAACYFVFPAVGAYWLFARSFPLHSPAVSTVPLVPVLVNAAVPRNCMPSLHTAWALVAFWAAGKCGWLWRWTLRGLLLIMLLQTLAYHYLADMIVAIPFTLALYAITQGGIPWSAIERRAAAGFGISTVAIWLVVLRWGTALFQSSPMIPWGAALCTVVGGAWLWRALDHAGETQTADELEPQPQAIAVAAGSAA
jgi:hypothetical protein